MDPFAGLATFVLGMLEKSAISLWWKLIFEMLFSGTVSFLIIGGTTMGSVLITARPAVAVVAGLAAGMVAAGISMTVCFRRSPLTKGLMVVLPQLEALKELDSDVQTIQK